LGPQAGKKQRASQFGRRSETRPVPPQTDKGGVIAERTGKRLKSIDEAADDLRLPVETLRALAHAGYLPVGGEEGDDLLFALSDLKAFTARNAPGADDISLGMDEAPDTKELLDVLASRSDEMARRAYDIFAAAVPETALWTDEERHRFVDQSRKRFEAILAVTGQGAHVDEALVDDLNEVGASAAWAGSPLPQLLVVLRISRDLVVQSAVAIAEEGGRRWGLALSLLLTRVLPAMDRLTDALAQGYWAAVVGKEETDRARYEHVVESSSDGIYEIDITGRLSYANPSLAAMVGVPAHELAGARLDEVLSVVGDASVLDRLTEGADVALEESLEVLRADGVRRELSVLTFPRHEDGMVVGYQGIVRDVTAGRRAERAKNEFLAMVTHDLRSPITSILGLAVTLEAYAGELPVERLRRTGHSIRIQAERISRLADDLYEVSRLESQSLRLDLRATSVAGAVEAALSSLAPGDHADVVVEEGLVALADSRRLEQVVANLVENALTHGAGPVRLEAAARGGGVEISVSDSGPGVPDALVPTLFSRLGGEAGGVGLFLVRGLVEAMGGRVAYEPAPGGTGSVFRVRLLHPPRR
jgi:PAS domain S-box-containing protein